MMNNPLHLQQQQYVFELNEHDVLCGRGSGPNDRVGNIEFRNLVLSRKAEYLAAPSRDAKGRIATNIVDTVRLRGGRFLKKLSPAQAKEAGFKRGMNVYELADESTVLEKAKQTLRQNRAEFVKEHGKTGGAIGPGGTPALTPSPAIVTSPTPTPSSMINNYGGMTGATSAPALSQQQLLSNQLAQNQNGNSNSIQGSMNPIPLEGSVSLDSMQRPNLSARTAQQLNNALFNSNISSVTNPSVTGPMLNMSSADSLQMGGSNQMGSTNSGGSILSMNTTELCAAMGGSNVFNSNTTNSNMSGTSTQAFGSLINEYTSEEEKNLMQQFEELKKQQEILLQQQQSLPGNTNFQSGNMQFIPEDQQVQQQLQYNHQNYQEGPQQQLGQQDDNNPTDVFASLVRQYAPDNPMFNTQPQQFHDPAPSSAVGLNQQNQVSLNQQNQPQEQQQSQGVTSDNFAPNQNNTSSNGDLTGSILRRLSDHDQQKLMEQFQLLQQRTQQTLAASAGNSQNSQTQYNVESSYLDSKATLNDVNNSQQSQMLTGSYVNTTTSLKGSQPLEYGVESSYLDSKATLNDVNDPQQSQMPAGAYVDTTTSLKDSQPPQYGVESYFDSKTTLNDSQATLPTGSLQGNNPQPSQYGTEAYMDSTTQLNDSQATLPSGSLAGLNNYQSANYQPTKKQPPENRRSSDGSNDSRELPKWDPSQRRRSSVARRRSTLGRDNRSGSGAATNGPGNSMTSQQSRRLSGLSTLEPADLSEDSLRLSFLTANHLAKTLDDMSTTSMWMSGTSMAMKQSVTSKASFKSQLDCSMLSLMSMSLSEIAPELLPQNQNDPNLPKSENTSNGPSSKKQTEEEENENSDSHDKILKGLEEEAEAKSPPTRPVEVTVKKKGNDELGLSESVMSFGQSLDEGAWNPENH